jgi:hypothetical protein
VYLYISTVRSVHSQCIYIFLQWEVYIHSVSIYFYSEKCTFIVYLYISTVRSVHSVYLYISTVRSVHSQCIYIFLQWEVLIPSVLFLQWEVYIQCIYFYNLTKSICIWFVLILFLCLVLSWFFFCINKLIFMCWSFLISVKIPYPVQLHLFKEVRIWNFE